jgi:hypothetical protein
VIFTLTLISLQHKLNLMQAKTKNGFPPKICLRCERPFEWRKKWARDWENVKYCSEKCKAGK